MEHNGSASNAGKIHQNRLSSVTEDEDQDAALTIVTVLDRVATVVDSVQASQKRIEERHREMGNAIKSVQIDLLKLSQSHSNTGYVVNKLFEKTRKVSAHIKDVKARVEKQQVRVTKVETKQEEIMKKNKFRVVIFQVSSALWPAGWPQSLSSFASGSQGCPVPCLSYGIWECTALSVVVAVGERATSLQFCCVLPLGQASSRPWNVNRGLWLGLFLASETQYCQVLSAFESC